MARGRRPGQNHGGPSSRDGIKRRGARTWAVVEGNDVLAQSVEVKAYFIRGAVRDPGMIYPSRSWGFGRLNVARAFEIIAGTTSS